MQNIPKKKADDFDIIDKTYKLCRKSALMSEELINSLKRIEDRVVKSSNSSSNSNSNPSTQIPLTCSDIIEVIDGLNKISGILKSDIDLNDVINKETLANILRKSIDLICDKSGISATSSIGNVYNNNTDIVMTTKNTDQYFPKGTILNIISQGYIKNGQELLKKAKVVVSV